MRDKREKNRLSDSRHRKRERQRDKQQSHDYLRTITHKSAIRYLDTCQVGSAFGRLCLFKDSLSFSKRGENKRLRLEILDCRFFFCCCCCQCKKEIKLLMSKVHLMQSQSVIVYLDEPPCCKLMTIPFRLSQFLEAADLLSCKRSAFPQITFTSVVFPISTAN